MNDVIVFLGPTLDRAEARTRLQARYLPPVSQGDIISVVDEAPKAIGIVDGYFQLVPAVWHKEILYALDRGIPVYGAASMGALRAAELDAFGMIGVGRIYRWYRSGFLDADDEVAVIHAPHAIGHQALSEAMVNIRATLDAAVQRGALSLNSALVLLDACAATPYWERRYDRLLADAQRLDLPPEEISALAACDRVDQKRLDALQMLDLLAETTFEQHDSCAFSFNATTKFARLRDRDTCLARIADGRITTGAFVDYYLLEGYRLGAGRVSLTLAREGLPARKVIAALRNEGIYETVLNEALARDTSDGPRPSEATDSAALQNYCKRAGLDTELSHVEVANIIGIDDPERFLERLHRFGPLVVLDS